MLRVGQGYDVHQLAAGRPLIIGGVRIPHDKGLAGHSDADVLLHAISDALLGAAAAGDIGKHFPDTDEAYKNADSLKLLMQVWDILKKKNIQFGNVDATIIAERPKMSSYIDEMRKTIAKALDADIDQVNIKATTTEKLGFVGRGEGIAAEAIALIHKAK
jgi:2-C-methyl-D-erythritol 2,4-cyclodiphosphate synthase